MVKKSFNDNWTFIKNGEEMKVNLPHDAMLHEARYKGCKSGGGCAYFDGGFYTYKKSFMVPEEWKDKSVYLEVEGAYRNSKVYLNDVLLKEHKYGYTGYFVCLDETMKVGSANTLMITCDNTEVPNSRWYSGAGLYRPVNLFIGNKRHFSMDSVKLSTVSVSPVTLSYKVPYTGDTATVTAEVYDGDKLICKNRGKQGMMTFPATPWSLENPKQYSVHFTLEDAGEILDAIQISYGFRTLSFTKSGFYLNGKRTYLQGCCLHHDNGILGAVSSYDAEMKKLKALKAIGFNAVRCSHNPASRSFLKACDDLGMLVLDELTDIWYDHKNPYDYATDFMDEYMADLEAMIKKDFNHPSVIMYSLGNELSEPTSDSMKGLAILKKMITYIHKEDYRPTTMGINFTNLPRPELKEHKEKFRMFEVYGDADSLCPDYNSVITALGDGMAEIACAPDSERVSLECLNMLDVAGYNYAYKRYEMDNEIHPDRLIIGSETMCKDVYNNFKLMKKFPQVFGDFVWTGYDYIGEVGIGGYADPEECYFTKQYPWILGNVGALDLLGAPTGEAMLAGITYGKMKLRIATRMPKDGETLSAWRWTNSRETYSYGKENTGRKVVAEVYTVYPYVELFLNGRSLGKRDVIKGYVEYEFPYAEGTLKAVSTDYSDHQEVMMLKSALQSRLSLRKDYAGKDIIYVYAEFKDFHGTLDTTKAELLTATVEGGELLGFGSANPKTEDDYTKNRVHAWNGMALLAIRKTDSVTRVSVKGEHETASLSL